MQKQSISFGPRGNLLLVYQFLAYCGYCAFTNFPQNVMSDYYGGQTTTIVLNNEVINHVNYGSERKISDIIYFATAMPEGA